MRLVTFNLVSLDGRIGQAEAPAVFEGFGLGTGGVPALLQLVSAEARPDGSIFARYTVL